ncbi:hypothetical protein PENTCL1PPCAC_24866, partial [Pristionchus entomophagus]
AMTDTEAMPKPEEVAGKEEAKETTPAPAKQKDLVADDTSSAKSPSKSPAKTPKKAAEAVDDTSPVKSPAKSPAKSPKKAAEEKPSPAKSAKASPSKTPAKSSKKSKKEESEEEEEEDEEIEEKKGILDMPLVIEGKRKRESTSFLKVEENISTKHKAPVVAGSGTALEDIPFIAHQIDTEKKVDDLRSLYRICYGTKGKITVLRKELRKFNGFSFAKDTDEFKKKQILVNKLTKADLSHARRILGLHACSKKEEEVQTIMDFLVKPHDEGRSVPKKAKKARKSSVSRKGKTPGKKSPSKKKGTSNETVDTESDEDEKSSASGEEEEKEEEPKETPKKAAPKKRKAVEQKAKTPSKKAKKAESDNEEKEDDHSVTSSSDSSEKEKKEEKPELKPSDKEIKAKIVDLLKTFDLTAVSMKQMVLAVCNAFPDYPTLNERTSSIKTFIKEAIKEEEEA